MSVSTFQRITFVSCLVLCVSLFLPKIFLSRGQKELLQSEVGPGHGPPLRYSQVFSEDHDHDHWQVEPLYAKSYNPEAFSRTKGAGKPNLLAQVIPVYGFGIFLYIIYIFIKLTYKDKSPGQEHRFPIWTAQCTMQELPDYEMAQLQARLRQMEGGRERRASKAVHPSARSRRISRRREQRKLRQLRELTRVMLEGRPLEGVSPEVEAEETPYSVDWEGYPEETYPQYEMTYRRRRFPSVILEEPDMAPTAEELAERMGREEEEEEEEGDEEMEELENGSDEDEVDATENSLKELVNDHKTKEIQDKEVKEEGSDDNDEDDDDDDEEEDGPEEENEVEELENELDYHREDQKQEEQEDEEEEEEVGEDQPCLPQNRSDEDDGPTFRGARKGRKQITFSDHRRVFHYPRGSSVGCTYEDEEVKEGADDDDSEEDDEDDGDDDEDEDDVEEVDKQSEDYNQNGAEVREQADPLMEAESLAFCTEEDSDPEEQEVNLMDFLLTYQPDTTVSSKRSAAPRSPVPSTLRMRHKKQKKKI